MVDLIYYDIDDWKSFCFNRHDEVVNQKYSGLPYSFHLKLVVNQAEKFRYLLSTDSYNKCVRACYGHDLIEDTRLTYNDVKQFIGEEIADIIFCCTEDKGKTRDERHSDKNLKELAENPLAIFVKLCDIIANVKFGLLSNSTQFSKYRKEYPKVKEFLYKDGYYKDMFDYLDKIYELNAD